MLTAVHRHMDPLCVDQAPPYTHPFLYGISSLSPLSRSASLQESSTFSQHACSTWTDRDHAKQAWLVVHYHARASIRQQQHLVPLMSTGCVHAQYIQITAGMRRCYQLHLPVSILQVRKVVVAAAQLPAAHVLQTRHKCSACSHAPSRPQAAWPICNREKQSRKLVQERCLKLADHKLALGTYGSSSQSSIAYDKERHKVEDIRLALSTGHSGLWQGRQCHALERQGTSLACMHEAARHAQHDPPGAGSHLAGAEWAPRLYAVLSRRGVCAWHWPPVGASGSAARRSSSCRRKHSTLDHLLHVGTNVDAASCNTGAAQSAPGLRTKLLG